MSDLQDSFLVGFGTSDITPPVGVELTGFGWYLERRSTGVIEPLLARAMIWQAEGKRGMIISCDLIGVTRELAKDVRTRISIECQVPFENILVCATHTHSGPAVYNCIGWGERDFGYLETLPVRIASAAKLAASQMAAAELEYGEVKVEGISYNRDYKGGQTDSLLKVAKFMKGGKMAGFLVNYSCHPVVMCEQTSLISGDFVGLAMNKIGSEHGCTGIFLQGSCGDQNSIYCHKPQEESIKNLYDLSGKFAGFIEMALNCTKPVLLDKTAATRKEITLPLVAIDKPSLLRTLNLIDDLLKRKETLPADIFLRLKFEKAVYESIWNRYEHEPLDERKTEIQAFAFGNIVMVTQPSEFFFSFHKKIEEQLLQYKTFIIGYANDYIGYVPSQDKFDVSQRVYSYPAYFVSLMIGEFPFRMDVGDILSDEMIKLVRSM